MKRYKILPLFSLMLGTAAEMKAVDYLYYDNYDTNIWRSGRFSKGIVFLS